MVVVYNIDIRCSRPVTLWPNADRTLHIRFFCRKPSIVCPLTSMRHFNRYLLKHEVPDSHGTINCFWIVVKGTMSVETIAGIQMLLEDGSVLP